MIYITKDGTWGDANDVMVVDIDAFQNDEEVQRILSDMYAGADAQELWRLLV